jgi:hypothetical protein
MTGTSQAAPLVSAAAAILGSYGLSAPQIKSRLIASVELKSGLYSALFSGGLFSFEKSIDVFYDIVLASPLDSGGVTERGLIVTDKISATRDYLIAYKADENSNQITSIPLSKTLKISVTKERTANKGPMVRVVYNTTGKIPEVRIDGGEFMTRLRRVGANGQEEEVPLKAGLDVVLGTLVARLNPEARRRAPVPIDLGSRETRAVPAKVLKK